MAGASTVALGLKAAMAMAGGSEKGAAGLFLFLEKVTDRLQASLRPPLHLPFSDEGVVFVSALPSAEDDHE